MSAPKKARKRKAARKQARGQDSAVRKLETRMRELKEARSQPLPSTRLGLILFSVIERALGNDVLADVALAKYASSLDPFDPYKNAPCATCGHRWEHHRTAYPNGCRKCHCKMFVLPPADQSVHTCTRVIRGTEDCPACLADARVDSALKRLQNPPVLVTQESVVPQPSSVTDRNDTGK